MAPTPNFLPMQNVLLIHPNAKLQITPIEIVTIFLSQLRLTGSHASSQTLKSFHSSSHIAYRLIKFKSCHSASSPQVTPLGVNTCDFPVIVQPSQGSISEWCTEGDREALAHHAVRLRSVADIAQKTRAARGRLIWRRPGNRNSSVER